MLVFLQAFLIQSQPRNRSYVRHLSKDIEFHTVGTVEHAVADGWVVDMAHEVSD